MGIGVITAEACILRTEGYWSAQRQPYSLAKRTNPHDFRAERVIRKRITVPAIILIWLLVILIVAGLTAMVTVVNADAGIGGRRTGRMTPSADSAYTGNIANTANYGNNAHNYKQFSGYNGDSDIYVNGDMDLDDDDEEELENESNTIDGRLSGADIEKLHAIVMQGLRLTRIPDVANVSRRRVFLRWLARLYSFQIHITHEYTVFVFLVLGYTTVYCLNIY